MMKKLNDLDYDNLAELETSWRYVSEGWCEQAGD
jgi:hypothetical protein